MRVKDIEGFIKKAKAVHGDRYDYSKSIYIKTNINTVIICSKHGEFKQKPNYHLNGSGCIMCKHDVVKTANSSTYEDFMEKSILIHGLLYSYELVEYVNRVEKVKIICKKHGVFKQTPAHHIIGSGCPKCFSSKISNINRMSLSDFISKSKLKHGNKYKYDLVDYKHSNIPVDIICPTHGVFKQIPNSHTRGRGCAKCSFIENGLKQRDTPGAWSISSWDKKAKTSKYFDSFKVYIIMCWNDKELFFKVGRTFMKSCNRFKGSKTMPYNYEIIEEYIFDNAKEAFDKETDLKRINKNNKYIPLLRFGGMYECFKKIKL